MADRNVTEIDRNEHPDDPPGIDPATQDMPLVAEAAERVIEFIKWFGDGRVFVDPDESSAPPLYARDMEALTRLVTAASQRLHLTEEPGYHHMIPMAAAVLDDGTEIRMRNLGDRVEIRTWDATRSCSPPDLAVDPLAGRHVIDVRPSRPAETGADQ